MLHCTIRRLRCVFCVHVNVYMHVHYYNGVHMYVHMRIHVIILSYVLLISYMIVIIGLTYILPNAFLCYDIKMFNKLTGNNTHLPCILKHAGNSMGCCWYSVLLVNKIYEANNAAVHVAETSLVQ